MTFSLDTLNPPQREAVTYHGDKHCLILAGAGSGKTRVLTHRIAWLISQGIAPSSILAITFTNKAAAEMRERALALIDEDANSGLQLSTFHAFGARFLRHYAAYANLESSFSIYAETEQKGLIKKIMTDLRIIGEQADQGENENKKNAAVVNEYMYGIMAWKEAGTTPAQAANEAKSKQAQLMAEVYSCYEKELIKNNAVDFAGLLQKPLEILTKFENVRMRVQARYRHILVDEFQDTNTVQLDLLQVLCGPGTQLTVVGDDDQSIYTWRGADPGAILHFDDRYGACEVFKLEQNYRSTQPILTCAGNLIACNEVRTEKRLWTDRKGGEKVRVIAYESDWDEASDVVTKIIARRRALCMPWEKIAILYRKNSQSVSFERECTHHAVPYQVIGATGFYEREEIVDLIAYLKVLVNPADMVAFRRIINKPARGIGEKTCDKLIELVEKKLAFGLAPSECLIGLLQDIAAERCKIPRAGAKVVNGCNALLALFERVENWRERAPRDVLLDILDETHFLDHLKKVTEKKGQEFSDAEDRIHSLIQELDAYQEKSPNDLQGFLEDMTLIRPEADDTRHAVNLMTIHAAKGLEFDLVYIVGVADGTLPLERSGSCDVEEERRLMYVAMTRARNELTMSYANTTHEYGRVQPQTRSRFFDEMTRADDGDIIDFTEVEEVGYGANSTPKLAWSTASKPKPKPQRGYFEENDPPVRPFGKKKVQNNDGFTPDHFYEDDVIDISKERTSARGSEPEPVKVPADTNLKATSRNGRVIAIGTRVSHSIHGRGEVVRLEKAGNDYKATVDFRRAGIRTIIARFLDVI